MTRLACACGQLALEVDGEPIVTVECCCDSCRQAAASWRVPVLQPTGGTPFVLYRKDRVRFVAGTEHLREMRLTPSATTRRVLASCCDTPVFLEFHGGHWLSLYSALWPEHARPALEMRTMTRDLPDRSALPDDVPNYRIHSLSFTAKLLWAWIAMGLRSPELAFVRGAHEP